MSETIEKYGHLDILINNAGFSIYGSIETLTMEHYDSIMATNVRGAVQLTQLAVPYLIETKGNIVNISSAAGIMPIPQACVYSMSKAALDQFTKCVAMDLASKQIRCNSVNPGKFGKTFSKIINIQFLIFIGSNFSLSQFSIYFIQVLLRRIFTV